MYNRSKEYFSDIEAPRPGFNYELLLPAAPPKNRPLDRDRLYELRLRTIACLLNLPYYYTKILHYIDLQQTLQRKVRPIYTSNIKLFCVSISEDNVRRAVWHMGCKGFLKKFKGGVYEIHELILKDEIIKIVRGDHTKTF